MRAALLLALLLSGGVWAQPPSSEPEKQQAIKNARGEEDEDAVPSAKDTTRPAVFNVMIAGAQKERAGTPIHIIRQRSIMPWVFSLILLPVYLHIARRRGFRIR